MNLPTPAQAAAYNRAALSIALTCDTPGFSERDGNYRAAVSFEGYLPHGKATLMLESGWWYGKPQQGGVAIDRVAFLANGRETMAMMWSDGTAEAARLCRHSRIDVADLFSTDGDHTLHETMELVAAAFAKIRAALEEWMRAEPERAGAEEPWEGLLQDPRTGEAFPTRHAPGVGV